MHYMDITTMYNIVWIWDTILPKQELSVEVGQVYCVHIDTIYVDESHEGLHVRGVANHSDTNRSKSHRILPYQVFKELTSQASRSNY